MDLFKKLEGLKTQSLFIDEESLTISFGTHRVVIYNVYYISKPEYLVAIPKSFLRELVVDLEKVMFIFSNECIISVGLNDEDYNGPEAIILYDADRASVIWS